MAIFISKTRIFFSSALEMYILKFLCNCRDHGAIIFLDSRFSDLSARQALSSWLQPFFQVHAQIGTAIKGIAGFFKTDSLVGRLRGEVIAEHTALIKKNGGVRRERVEVKLEEAVPVSIKPDEYKCGVEDASTAKSIFSTSSERINFATQSSQPVFRVPNPVSAARPPPRKRLKIAVKGFPTAGSAPSAGDENRSLNAPPVVKDGAAGKPAPAAEDAQEKARSYVSMLKKTISSGEFTLFKSAMKLYKANGDLENVKRTLDTVMTKYLVSRPELITGFKVFIKKQDAEEFDKFCDVTIAGAGEVTQVPV